MWDVDLNKIRWNPATWQNMPCRYIDPDDGTKVNGLLIQLYEIRDPDAVPTDEVFETESIVDPWQSISASWSSDTCSVSMSGSLWWNTKTVTRSRKVREQIRVWLILRSDGVFVYDIPVEDINITAQDLSN